MKEMKGRSLDIRLVRIPKLRFSEFIGQSWSQVELGNVTAECTARNTDMSLPPESVMGVTKADGIVPMEERLIGADTSRYKIVRKDWFAYNPMRLNIGSIARWGENTDILVSPDYVVFRCLEEGTSALNPEFFDQFRRSPHWEDFVRESGIGSVRVRIYYKHIARLRLALPSLAEQQKIAECLSTLDELIDAESGKFHALKAHKKGLMQQLFPREGETRPRLRFPEFRANGEWRMESMGELLLKKPEYGVNAPAVPYSENLPTYLRITDIDDDGRLLSGSEASVDIEVTEDDFLLPGDIVLARTGASVGKSYQHKESDGRLVFAGFLIRIRPSREKVNATYLAHFLRTDRYWDWVRTTSARSGQPGLNASEYSSLLVPLPPPGKNGLAEQQRIADCLSSLDDLIAAQSDKLKALRAHKRGLMQQLFPSPSAIES